MKHVYILSTGRTGTQFLAYYFDRNFNTITALHEPKPSYLLRIASNAYAAGALSSMWAKRLFHWSRRRLFSQLDTDIYIESNNFLYGLAPLLPELLDEVMIVHVVRDPREYVRSTINHGSAAGLKKAFSHFVPYWSIEGHSAVVADTELEKAIYQFARNWVYVNRYLTNAGQKIEHYHCLSFESIVSKDYEGLHDLCGLLGVSYPGESANHAPSEKVNKSQHQYIAHWEDWPTNHQQIVLDLCGPLMEQYGYDPSKT